MANQIVNIDVEIGTKDLTKLNTLLKDTGVTLQTTNTELQSVGNSVNDVVVGLGEVGTESKSLAKVENAALAAAGGAEKLAEETKNVGKASKDAGEEATILGDVKSKFNDLTKGVKKVIVSMKTLKGAIISTGIGALIAALGTLIAYFTTSEEGSKKLAIATETLGLLFGKLTEFAASVGETIVNAFNNPVEAIKNLGTLIVNNIIERFRSAIEAIGFLGKAIGKLFKGDFAGAKDAAKEAGKELVDVFTGVDNSAEKIAETGTKAFKAVKKAVEEATVTATKLVTAQRALRDLQQELTVQNAELTKELEGQKRIAEDTTLDYETRKTALEEVNRIQIQLAENVATQAKAEEDLLKTQIANEANYEKREELESQLADKTRERIEAETNLQTVKQEADKVGRELETEEVARKTEINDILAQLDLDRIEDVFEKARKELEIEEQKLLDELRLKKASEEEIARVEKAFADKRKKLKKEETDFNKKLDKEEAENQLQLASQTFGALASLLGESSAAGKAAAVAQATIDTYAGADKAFAQGGIFGFALGAVIIAAGLANVNKILNTPIPGTSGTGGSAPVSGTSRQAPNLSRLGEADLGLPAPQATATQPAVRAYVLTGDINSSQEADSRLNRRRSLG